MMPQTEPISPNRPIVRVFYIEPQDVYASNIKFESDKRKLDFHLKESQRFFADQMEDAGYGRKTFILNTMNNKVIVDRLKLPENLEFYLDFNREIIYEQTISLFDREARTDTFLFYVNLESGVPRACGFGLSVEKNGFVFIFENCLDTTTISHELGHAFGLHHDFRDNSYVMSYGINRTKFSDSSLAWFNNHASFNNHFQYEQFCRTVHDYHLEEIGSDQYFIFEVPYYDEDHEECQDSDNLTFITGILYGKSDQYFEAITSVDNLVSTIIEKEPMIWRGLTTTSWRRYKVLIDNPIPENTKQLKLVAINKGSRVKVFRIDL